MKKLLFFILIATSVLHSYSQFYIGPKIGLNMSSASVMPSTEGSFSAKLKEVSDFVPKLALNFGAVTSVKLFKGLYLQTEFVYNGKGLKAKIDRTINDTSLTGNWNYTFHYFEIPLMFKYVMGSGGFGPYIEAGVHWGYFIDASYEIEMQYGNEKYESSYKIDTEYDSDDDNTRANRNEFGFRVGIGLEFQANNSNKVFVSLRYAQGLTDVVEYKNKPDNYQKNYNRIFQLSIAYQFEISTSSEDKIYYY